MSVQLILYPQSFDGTSNPLSGIANEFVVNGISFLDLGSTSSYDSSASNVPLDVLTNQPPSVINTWYRFRTTSSGTPSLPTVTSGNLVLNSNTTLTLSGVYQRLSNLIVGQQYTVILNNISNPASGIISVNIFDGTSLVASQSNTAPSQVSYTFTATAADNTIMINYFNTISNNVTISSISVTPKAVTASGAIQLLDNGQVICDLYEDEDIPLTLSVDDFKNVAEQVQSYSKAFNLPATKRNNLIFNQMYEITRSDDGIIFNPYVKTKCVLKQDGFLLFEGYMRMIDVSDKDGEISYNVNLYSEVTALADVLKDRTFSDLDFTELEHAYNYTNIRNTWVSVDIFTNPSTSGFRDNSTVKYPFIDWNHQYTVSSSGNPVLPNLECAFRPWINMKYLVDRIFNAPDTPFTYTSNFLSSNEFEDLYMDFNWGSDRTPETGEGSYGTGDPINTSTGSFQSLFIFDNDFPSDAGYDTTTHKFTAAYDNQTYTIDTEFYVTNLNSSASLQYYWSHEDSSGNTINSAFYTPWITSGPFIVPWQKTLRLTLNQGDTLQFKYKSTAGNSQQYTSSLVVSIGYVLSTTETLLQTLRGELGQWDFLKGIMTMFNLVTLVDPDNPNNLLIETYQDVFIANQYAGGASAGTTLASRGITYDWTDKIDVSQMKLEPLTDLNKKTIFKFVEDDDDFCFTRYKEQVGGHLYGSKEWDASTNFNGQKTVLTGEDEIVAEPFAATVCAPLMPQYSDFIIPKMYTKNDEGSEGFDNSPRIMYNNLRHDLVSCVYTVPKQNGVLGDAAEDQYLRFSHLTDVPTNVGSTDFNFGECQLAQGLGNSPTSNMFNTFWLPYYSELYNANTRTMTIKVALNAGDISTFKFNDKVMIKNREFRVNKIDYKPNDLATVEFILIG